MRFGKIALVFAVLILTSSIPYAWAREALNIELENVHGESKPFIPDNQKASILFLGGRETKDMKTEWYKTITSNLSDVNSLNLIIIVQLSDIPKFVPRYFVENKVKDELLRLQNQFYHGENVYSFFDWGGEITSYYQVDIKQVKLVVVDKNKQIVGEIEEDCSQESLEKLRTLLDNTKM